MPISFVRVDDRVIHGQVVTQWTKIRPCNGILVIDDNIAKDEFRCKVLKAAAPTGVKVGIYTIEEGLEKIKLAKNAKNSYFVISNSPINFAKLLEKGADFGTTLNIGPMNARAGAKMVGKTLYIDEKDKEAFEYIEGKGVKCEFQIIPSEPVLGWDKVKEKY